MTNLKRICLMVVVMVIMLATAVLATDAGNKIHIDLSDTNELSSGTTNTNTNADTNTNTNTNTNTMISGGSTNTNTNSSTYNNTTNLPQTGAGDYTMILMIGVLVVFAVYAYKKVRDYKNID